MIYLLTGPIGTGKTTQLTKWVAQQQQVAGILSPVIEGKRHLQDITSGASQLLEATATTQQPVQVGRYTFDETVFTWARACLQEALKKSPRYLIIDEIGKLELRQEGLEPAVTEVLQAYQQQASFDLILVIRDTLLEKSIAHYTLTAFRWGLPPADKNL
ncbi:MAG: nucleoside-triphosphatase [Thermonemataceae bacterium]